VNKFWCFLFIAWPIVAIAVCVVSPGRGWWFPGESASPLGDQIDELFYLILVIVAVVFVGTEVALGYVLVRGSRPREGKALFTHGSHNLEVIWTIVPSGILLFSAMYQMDVWAQFRVQSNFPQEAVNAPIAEVTARQFEWQIRYPAEGKTLRLTPQPDDLHTVNELHVPSGRPVLIQLRTGDVQHSFFLPRLRVKQDALPGQIIPVWFEVKGRGEYELVCAELCGWGHYKMKARLVADTEEGFRRYLKDLRDEQFDDGIPDEPANQNGEATQ
jgi:cytochrome c oxidase subunit 2